MVDIIPDRVSSFYKYLLRLFFAGEHGDLACAEIAATSQSECTSKVACFLNNGSNVLVNTAADCTNLQTCDKSPFFYLLYAELPC